MPKRLTNKSRKMTLMKMLAGIGELAGIDCHRTPGEECAIRIAIKLIEKTPIGQLDYLAEGIKDADNFWEKSW